MLSFSAITEFETINKIENSKTHLNINLTIVLNFHSCFLVHFPVFSSPGTSPPRFAPLDICPQSFMQIIQNQFGNNINSGDHSNGAQNVLER